MSTYRITLSDIIHLVEANGCVLNLMSDNVCQAVEEQISCNQTDEETTLKVMRIAVKWMRVKSMQAEGIPLTLVRLMNACYRRVQDKLSGFILMLLAANYYMQGA